MHSTSALNTAARRRFSRGMLRCQASRWSFDVSMHVWICKCTSSCRFYYWPPLWQHGSRSQSLDGLGLNGKHWAWEMHDRQCQSMMQKLLGRLTCGDYLSLRPECPERWESSSHSTAYMFWQPHATCCWGDFPLLPRQRLVTLTRSGEGSWFEMEDDVSKINWMQVNRPATGTESCKLKGYFVKLQNRLW